MKCALIFNIVFALWLITKKMSSGGLLVQHKQNLNEMSDSIKICKIRVSVASVLEEKRKDDETMAAF
jgi:hypothetical protein